MRAVDELGISELEEIALCLYRPLIWVSQGGTHFGGWIVNSESYSKLRVYGLKLAKSGLWKKERGFPFLSYEVEEGGIKRVCDGID